MKFSARQSRFERLLLTVRPFVVWLRILVVMLAVHPAMAQSPLEAGVKAAYLYKFLGYVEWPTTATGAPVSTASADAPLTIGVAGSELLLAELQKVVAGRQINGRPLLAKKLSAGDAVDGLHALYIGRTAAFASMLITLKGRPVLVVTDLPDGLPDGAALNFVLVDGRVRFEASVSGAERAGLRLSARLLAVAERVVPP